MSGRGVLVVDDDTAVRTLMMAWLQAEGYDVHTARNGMEALIALQRDVPSVLVVDLNMPVMGGAELRRRQLAMPALAGIPFILVSAAHDAERIARDLGIEVLFKPCDADQLLRSVAAALPDES